MSSGASGSADPPSPAVPSETPGSLPGHCAGCRRQRRKQGGEDHDEVLQAVPGRARIDASFKDEHDSQEHAQPEIEAYARKVHDLQYLLYAEVKRSLLPRAAL